MHILMGCISLGSVHRYIDSVKSIMGSYAIPAVLPMLTIRLQQRGVGQYGFQINVCAELCGDPANSGALEISQNLLRMPILVGS
jgi:hypothetical protein